MKKPNDVRNFEAVFFTIVEELKKEYGYIPSPLKGTDDYSKDFHEYFEKVHNKVIDSYYKNKITHKAFEYYNQKISIERQMGYYESSPKTEKIIDDYFDPEIESRSPEIIESLKILGLY